MSVTTTAVEAAMIVIIVAADGAFGYCVCLAVQHNRHRRPGEPDWWGRPDDRHDEWDEP